MMILTEKIVRQLIILSQKTLLHGTGGYSCDAMAIKGNTDPFPQAKEEASHFGQFFSLFETPQLMEWFQGKVVLDLGCGYGGKTAEYVTTCHVKQIHGIEPFPNVISQCRKYVAERGIENCSFNVCNQHEIPFDNETFDAVVSHDVLEHVDDPRITLKEIHRVLKTNGHAFIIFPPYHGMFSHHLSYITNIPALHLFFSPDTLIRAVNSVLKTPYGKRFGTFLQPMPKLSYNSKRMCLPTLNGLTGSEYMQMLNGFCVEEMRYRLVMSRYLKKRKPLLMLIEALMKLGDLPRDFFTGSIVSILRKESG